MLSVVGIGPGNREGMTGEAEAALRQADVIVGYTAYVDLIRPLLPEKVFVATGMMQEVDRCRQALDLARDGREVAVVSSGDSGVYGMAGLILELAGPEWAGQIRIVAGVTAALSGAAVLGAPLMHDFAVISLSDLLTDWEKIELRLELAAQADLVICLYNPASRRRADYLARAARILLRHKSAQTVCGWVRNIGRDGCASGTLELGALSDLAADMFTTVWVGNSETRLIGGRMVTPRGYGHV